MYWLVHCAGYWESNCIGNIQFKVFSSYQLKQEICLKQPGKIIIYVKAIEIYIKLKL